MFSTVLETLNFIYLFAFACHLFEVSIAEDVTSEGRLLPGFLRFTDELFAIDLLVTSPFSLDFGAIGFGRKRRELARTREGKLDVRLAKLESILVAIGAEELECYEAVICTVHERPKIFGPLLTLLGNVLDTERIIPVNKSRVTDSWTDLLYDRYSEAARLGQSHAYDVGATSCGSGFGAATVAQCDHLASRILDNPVFRLLQFIDNFASVNI